MLLGMARTPRHGKLPPVDAALDVQLDGELQLPPEYHAQYSNPSPRARSLSKKAKLRATYTQKDCTPALPAVSAKLPASISTSYAQACVLSGLTTTTLSALKTPRTARRPRPLSGGPPQSRDTGHLAELPPVPKWLRKKMADVSKQMMQSWQQETVTSAWPFTPYDTGKPGPERGASTTDTWRSRWPGKDAEQISSADDSSNSDGGSRSNKTVQEKAAPVSKDAPRLADIPETVVEAPEIGASDAARSWTHESSLAPPASAGTDASDGSSSTSAFLKRRKKIGSRMRRHAAKPNDASNETAAPSEPSSAERLSSSESAQPPPVLKQVGTEKTAADSSRNVSKPPIVKPVGTEKTAADPSKRGGSKGRRTSKEVKKVKPRGVAQRSKSRVETIDMWIDIFKKVRSDNEIHHDELSKALQLIGFVNPDPALISDCHNSITKYSTLSEEDFVRFVPAFKLKEHQAHAAAFAKYDADGSGQIDREELTLMLKAFGVEPMNHVLKEVIDEVDRDGEGQLDLNEFEKCLELITTREGFCLQEYDDFMEVYRRFDRDGSGEIDTHEFLKILRWLGYTIAADMATEIAQEVDFDGSGTFSEQEFMACMKRVREHEISMVKAAIQAHDNDGSGTISGAELEAVFNTLGYIPDPVAVSEAAKDAGIDPQDEDLDLGELWRLLSVFRSREGFDSNEMFEITEAFTQFDEDESGEVSTLEVGKLLRWMGYALPVQVIQQKVSNVDVDGSEQLDLAELRKLIRMLRDDELRQVKAAFAKHDIQSKLKLSKTQAKAALHDLDIDMSFLAGEALLSLKAGDTPLKSFISVAIHAKKVSRKTFRVNCGFSTKEVAELRSLFKYYDDDDSGEIRNKELVRLVEHAFPEMAHDREMRPELMKIMAEVDTDGSGSLDLRDFLRLMKLLRELQDARTVMKEKEVIKATGLSTADVDGFRELFLDSDVDGSSNLTLEEVIAMIGTITPLGAKYMKELTVIFGEVAHRNAGPLREGVVVDSLDFSGFLLLIKRLFDTNFARIRDKTSGLGR